MRLLLLLLTFFGIEKIACGLNIESDIPDVNNDNKKWNIQQSSSRANFSRPTIGEFIASVTYKNYTDYDSKDDKGFIEINELIYQNLENTNQTATNISTINDYISNQKKKNSSHKGKVRRKKIRTREKSHISKSDSSDINIYENIVSKNNTLLTVRNKKLPRKSHRKSTHNRRDVIESQNNENENLNRNILKKRKPHRNNKKRKKIHQVIVLPTPLSNRTHNSAEGFTTGVNLQSLLNQTYRQQYNEDRNLRLHNKQQNKKSNYSSSSSTMMKNENRSENNNNYEEDAVSMSNENEWERLIEQEKEGKLLQEKRQQRRKQKLERMKQKQRKRKKIKTTDKDVLNSIVEGKAKRVEEIKDTHYGREEFVAQPSIDYFIEKPQSDSGDDVPLFGIVGVSLESPIKNLISTKNEISSPEILQKVLIPISVSVKENDKVYSHPVTPNSEDNVHSRTSINNDDDDVHKAKVTLANWQAEMYSDSDEDEEIKKDDDDVDDDLKKRDNIPRDDGDLSCVQNNFQPAPEVAHADTKYLRNEEHGFEKSFLEVEYICHHGYKIKQPPEHNIYCKNGKWIGFPPTCERVKNSTESSKTCDYPERCEQLCYVENGMEKCSCHRGFRMKTNNRCEDIDECAENISVCEFGCVNTIGSYYCKCPNGLRLGDENSCIDVNECLLRNGHGPCQDTCINTWGGYKCSCDGLPGTQLGTDGHSCTDIDECIINNGGCSHTCLNTMGRAFCLCPEGWTLDSDWKTCVDIDECAQDRNDNAEQKCEFGCINTPGSYSCLIDFGADQPIEEEILTECADGFHYNWTTRSCEDVNECLENNGGCYHYCVNTVGSYHCVCRPGYVLTGIDKYTCTERNSSSNTSCPALFPPKHGYLECSRPIVTDIQHADLNNIESGHHPITNRPGSQCVLRCPTGFRISGKFSKQCNNDGVWVGEDDGTCIRYPTPKLICPSDIVLEPSPNQTMAKFVIPRPKTDVNYERDVSVYPDWFRNSEVALELGVRNVTYTARHPVSKLSVSCSFKVTVLEGEPPVVKFCPQTQTYNLNKQHESIKIAWNEPIFTDNVNVTEISRTNSPGNSFGVGSHQIVYIAKDQAGHQAKCVFKILVNVPYKPVINHPLPIYHMFYKK